MGMMMNDIIHQQVWNSAFAACISRIAYPERCITEYIVHHEGTFPRYGSRVSAAG